MRKTRLALIIALVCLASFAFSAENLGRVPASSTVYFQFYSNTTAGAPVAPLSAYEAADLVIYKNNGATQRTSSSGVTMTSPFDSITGLHAVTIDLSDNTDAGFYAVGSTYHVDLIPDSETVDSVVTQAVLFTFRIGAAEDTAGYSVVTVKDGTGTGELDTASGTVLLTSATEAQIDAIETDTAGLDTGGELRTSLFGSDTNGATAAALATAQADLDNPDQYKATGFSTHSAADVWAVATRVLTAGTNLSIPSAATVASQVRTELTTELGRMDAAVSTRATPAQVNTEADTALADYDPPTKAEMDTGLGLLLADADYTAPPTVSAVADQVWDEVLSGHATGGTTGAALSGATAPSAATVADAVWDELLAGHTTTGSAGDALGDAGGSCWGSGDTYVDQDFGGTDALAAYIDGSPAADVWVRVYLTSDYDAGTYNAIAETLTDDFGDWLHGFYLDGGGYTLTYSKTGFFATTEITVP